MQCLEGKIGILNRANQTSVATEIGGFKERVSLAYMSLKTKIKSNVTQTPGYIATTHGNLESLVAELTKEFDVQEPIVIAKKGGTTTEEAIVNREGYTIAYSIDTEGNISTNGIGYITIWYSNNKLRSQLNNETAKDYNLKNTTGNNINSIKNELMLVSVIKVENYDANIAEFNENESLTVGITSLTKAGEDTTIGQEETYDGTFRGTSINSNLAEKDRSNGEGTIAPISKNKTYIGCYADVDDDGEVDGVIFADLAKSGSGIWNPNGTATFDNYGKYTWEAQSNFKNYYICKRNHNGIFGTLDVIAPKDKENMNDRFYVMALNNLKYECYWYRKAWHNMTTLVTSGNFGKGKLNTIKMLDSWNREVYGEKDSNDMWQTIKDYYDLDEKNKRWFVPSRAEWAAFGGELGINNLAEDSRNYLKIGLNQKFYATSSQASRDNAYVAYFYIGYMNEIWVGSTNSLRLATTF